MKQKLLRVVGPLFFVALFFPAGPLPASDFFNREPEIVNAVLKGDVTWRLPRWSSLGWSGKQMVEIWLWDDEKNERGEKLTETEIHYIVDYKSSWTTLEGTYATEQPVPTPENARVVIHAKLNIRVNNDPKEEEAISAVVTLPSAQRGEIKVPTLRRRVSR